MNCKIPFTKDIDFEHKLYEITSISLEHETKVEDGTLKGNFIISGDYKSHEVSINKEPFSYILPFEITLANNIDESTIEFLIEDFTYEVIENNILRVNIDFNVIASPKEESEESRNVNETDSLFTTPDSTLFADLDSSLNFSNNEEKEENIPPKSEEPVEEQLKVVDSKEEKLEMNINKEETLNENTIINNINTTDNSYATYHIRMVSDVETICTMYNSNMNILSEYNDLSNLSAKDKIIIPNTNE